MSKVTKTVVKKKAWKAFSTFLRTLWTKSGTVPCYTCDKLLTYKQVQVGHFVAGHSNAVYIQEAYVRPQCVGCNVMQGGRQGEFRDRLRNELGDDEVDLLLFQAKETVKISVEEYEELERFYKSALKDLLDK